MTEAQKIAYRLLETLVVAEADGVASYATFAKNESETSISYLIWMCHQIINHPKWDAEKANRWVGYIQGVMVCQGLTSVDEERSRVRQSKQN